MIATAIVVPLLGGCGIFVGLRGTGLGGDGSVATLSGSPQQASAGGAIGMQAQSPAQSPSPVSAAGIAGAVGSVGRATPAAPAVPPVTSGPAAGDPFAGTAFFVDPTSNAAIAATTASGAAATALKKVAAGPKASWFGGSSAQAVTTAVAARVAVIRAAHALPVLVAYDIPRRDCGGYSAGGAPSAAAYQSWIRAFASGLGQGRSAVILEPDALAGMDCLSAADQRTRLGLLSDAVGVLSASGASVYIDAGNSTWQGTATMAKRLAAAGVAQARGFSLNVSNFNKPAAETAYGDAIDRALGRQAHFVVDTSRDGLGPTADHQWCNPPGRALGPSATTATGDPLADAFYWIKGPGESDGSCNGGPPAGQWWTDYAIGLAQRS